MQGCESWGLWFIADQLWILETSTPMIYSIKTARKILLKKSEDLVRPYTSSQNSPVASGRTQSESQNFAHDI